MMQFAIIERKMAAKPADFPPDQRDEPRLHQLKKKDNFWCDYFLKKYRNYAPKNIKFCKYNALWLIVSSNENKHIKSKATFLPTLLLQFSAINFYELYLYRLGLP